MLPATRPGDSRPLELLNMREVADVLRCSVRHVQARTAAGDLPHIRLGARVLYPVAALEAYIADQLARSTPPAAEPVADQRATGRRTRAKAKTRPREAPPPGEAPRSSTGRIRPIRDTGSAP